MIKTIFLKQRSTKKTPLTSDFWSNISYIAILLLLLSSCYKLEDLTPDYEDGRSTVVYDLPGDTLATDGWDDNYEDADLYLRQRYYNSRWTDTISNPTEAET